MNLTHRFADATRFTSPVHAGPSIDAFFRSFGFQRYTYNSIPVGPRRFAIAIYECGPAGFRLFGYLT